MVQLSDMNLCSHRLKAARWIKQDPHCDFRTVGPLAGSRFRAALFSLVLRLPPLSRLLLLGDFWALV